jgi:hypothetical protein
VKSVGNGEGSDPIAATPGEFIGVCNAAVARWRAISVPWSQVIERIPVVDGRHRLPGPRPSALLTLVCSAVITTGTQR